MIREILENISIYEGDVELIYNGGSKKLHPNLLKQIAQNKLVNATKVVVDWKNGQYLAKFNSDIELSILMSNNGKPVAVICDDSGVTETVVNMLKASKSIQTVYGGYDGKDGKF